MSVSSRSRAVSKTALGLVLATALAVIGLSGSEASASPTADLPGHGPATTKPTVVLVHGAWADSSSWDGVVGRLQDHGYTVDVFPNPLRTLAGDSAALRTYLGAITGPIVLVGHSYGGAVITDAATGNDNVKALVYLDAFAPQTGENVLQLAGATSALANPDPTQVFKFVPSTLPPTASTDLYVLATLFPAAFANDLPAKKAAILAVTQRPVTFGALTELSTVPAWQTIPSWYEIGTIDKVIPPDQQLMMATRAHSHVVRVRTSHLPMISHPAAVDRIIESAAGATG